MSNSARDQALVATFGFGAVVCASLGTVLFHLRGGALSLFRGGLRLVLAGFLLFASLWAVDGFVATFIDKSSASGCQIAVAFAAAFDQLARIVLEGFLFWAMKSDARATCGVLFPQAVFFLRFIIGGIFVGVQRPQFDPVCVATNLLWPLGVAVLCTDAFIVLTLVTRASSAGVFRDMRAEGPLGSRSRGISLIIMALGLWIPLSVPMILGISSFGIATRTALPAVGVLLVIGVIAFYFKNVILPLKAVSQKTAPFLDKFPGLSEDVPPPPKRELRNQEVSTIDSFGQPREYSREVTTSARDGNNQLPIISRPSPGQAAAGVGGMPVKGELFPPIRAGSLSAKQEDLLVQPTKKAVIKGGKLVISYPIVQEDKLSEASPLRRIATVDLATAARQDRERRVNPAVPLQPSTNRYSRQATKELQRRQVGGDSATRQTSASTSEPIEERASQAASSAVLSGLVTPSGGVRQRSPKHISQCFQDTFPPVTPATNASRSRSKSPTSRNSGSGVPLKPPPRSPLRPFPEKTTSATTLQGPGKPLAEMLDQTKAEEFKSSAAAPSSQHTSQTPPSRSESVSRRESIVSPSTPMDVLVPPVPPLSPRDLDSSSYYQLERNLSNQHRRSGPSSSIPRSGSVKNNIRPSRKRPKTPPPIDQVKPSKTPVQLRETTGLPSHPRARAAGTSASKSRDQTVMFVNSIDYNDPSRVRDIIDEIATDLAAKADWSNSDSRDSVAHRPRPIPRKSPITPSVLAKESPSVASTSDLLPPKKEVEARLKASVLTATAGESPSQPPPLPPPPPTPKSEPLEPARTKTSISRPKKDNPEVKEYITPVDQTGIALPSTTLRTQASHDRPRSEKNVNDKNTVANVTPTEYVEPSPSGKRKEDTTRYMSKFSIATTMSPEEPPSAYLQSPAFKLLRSLQEGLRRRSSPVLPVNDAQESATPASIVVDQPGAQSTTPSYAKQYIKPQDLAAGYVSKSLDADPVALGMPARVSYADSTLPNDEDDGREMVTFMLDRNTYYSANAASTTSPQNSIYGGTEGKKGSWHCRVGENPPTFSSRESMQSRRFPKPPPLELHRIFKRMKGSPPQPPPLETPKQAIDKIQEQLKKFKDSNVDDDDAEREKQRMSLLRDIEMEMGMEENRWRKMRDDLTRVSVLTIGSNPGSPFPHAASPSPSQNMQLPAINVAESSPKNNSPYLSVRETDTGRPRSSVLCTADQVQMSRPRRVPDRFQVTTTDNTSEISERAVREGVSISTRNTSPVAPSSPTNNETYSRFEIGSREQRPNQKGEVAPAKGVLWKLDNINRTPEITKSQVALWNSASDSAIQSIRSRSPGPRPVSRKPRESSPVEESGLWASPPESLIPQARSPSLWRAALQSPPSTPSSQESATRPRTLRPPRKSRRISSLPDILENPEPLENNRNALGIFRFPWGETSDAATVYTPFQNQAFMLSGNMGAGFPPIHPSLELQMQILRSQQQPSSFFEHHDEEEAVENISEDSDNDSFDDDDDDSFDETTLWEIASLLKSDRVPSRESLFPNNGNILPGSLTTQGPTDPIRPSFVPPARQVAEEEEPDHTESEPSPVPLLRRESSSPTLPPPEMTLWVNNVQMPHSAVNQGLFQDGKVWDTYVESYKPTARAPLRQTKAPNITSSSLWSQPAINTGSPPIAYLWSGESKSRPMVDATVEIKEISHPATPEPEFLWSIPKSTLDESVFGLPQPEPEHWDQYNDLAWEVWRPRPRKGGHLNIESQSLWTQRRPQGEQTNKKPGLEGTTPTSPSDGTNEGDTSPTATTTTGRQIAADDMTPSIETPINSPESEEDAISIKEQPTYDAGIIIGPQDDIVISSPLGNDLWVPISTLPLDEEHQGLFKVQQGGHQHDKKYRRSSKPPAALETRPTPRSSRRSLQKLESHTLWAPATPQTFAQDWVTLSSVRPSTPPGQLSSESGSESPLSDTSSVYSNVTGESTVASFLTGQASVQPKPHPVTNADWVASLKGTDPATRPRNETARSVPNWAAALHEPPQGAAQPSTASAPQPEQEALQSTNEETQPAVTEANAGEEISAPEKQPNPLSSRRETQIGGFDPARHHPVFNVYILDTSNGDDYHPAAEGYIHTLVNKNPDLIQRQASTNEKHCSVNVGSN
ncbi:hypothetical protein J3458_000465 [Metarhizium acridum]|uniref:uncharacterized protein n=1 Tax=Metarhizium acridum TaxID=92637 RepID=UPI001C6B857A|nr:hypothetical protein J3458_000465 [Metarhizium acridum]